MITLLSMETTHHTGLQERLRQARRYANLTQADVAERVKMLPGGARFGQTTLQSLESGRVKTTGYIVHIALACGVNPIWLATGEGDIAFSSSQALPDFVAEKDGKYVVGEVKQAKSQQKVSYSDVAVQLGFLVEYLDAEKIDMEDEEKLAVAKALARLKHRERPEQALLRDLLA